MSHENHVKLAEPAAPAGDVAAKMKARLADLKRRQEQRDEEREKKALESQLVEAELVDKYEQELGERGVYWQIFKTPEGFIVVKLGDWVHFKKFITSKSVNGVTAPEDAHSFAVANLVYPTREQFNVIADKFGALGHVIANELARMHAGRRRDEEGK